VPEPGSFSCRGAGPFQNEPPKIDQKQACKKCIGIYAAMQKSILLLVDNSELRKSRQEKLKAVRRTPGT
tara:strand:+ start:123 stop:329 length:207 start_codon:yes stop_codon:yes gene_type:complete